MSQSQPGNIRSCDVFKPIVLEQKYLMDYNAKYVLMFFVVQSPNSPFFPPHTGAEPGRAKRESRITCMRMLRTNQSKITMPLASVCRATQCLLTARALKNKTIFFDVDIVVKKKLKCGLSWSALLSTTSTRLYSFPKHSELAKIFERKVWRVQIAICIMQGVHFQVASFEFLSILLTFDRLKQ